MSRFHPLIALAAVLIIAAPNVFADERRTPVSPLQVESWGKYQTWKSPVSPRQVEAWSPKNEPAKDRLFSRESFFDFLTSDNPYPYGPTRPSYR